MKHKLSGDLIEVLSVNDLINPVHQDIVGRLHAGEELQDPERFSKTDLLFPSGEALPRCWRDAQYKS